MKLKKTAKPLAITIGDDVLNIEYYVDAVTLETLIDGPDGTDIPKGAKFVATVVAGYLKSWDLEDEEGKVGTSYADLIKQPASLIRAVFDAINRDGAPGEATGSN